MDEDIKKVINEWTALLKEFCSEEEDQFYLIEECEMYCSNEAEFTNKFPVIIKCINSSNCISGESLVEWSKGAKSKLDYYKKHMESKNYTDPEDYKFDDIDFDERNEVIEVVGLKNREEFLK